MVPLLQNNVDLDAPPTTNNNGNQHPSSSLFFPTATMSSDGAKNQQCCPSILPFPVRREQRASGGGAMQQNHGSGGLDSFFGLLLFLAATGKWCAGRVNGKVKYGSVKDVASMYSVSTRTVSRIWKKGIACVTNGVPVDTPLNLSGNVGMKRIQINPEDVARIPLNRRTTIRSLARALDMSKTSLHRRVKEGSLRSHSNAIKPMLTEENRKVRLQFCISMIDSSSSHNNPCFIDMYDRVHIDEKWFFLSRTSQKYYLLSEEDEPYRTCKSKKFITKVMFLCVVAHPRLDLERNEMFDGKIGIFPFVYKEAAKRRSKNREAGTLETKPIESSLQHQEAPRNVDELVAATHKAFDDISIESPTLNAVAVSEGMFVPTRPLCVSINIDGVCSDRLNSTQFVLANLKSSVAQVEKMLLDDKELLHSLEAEEQAPASTR
nr:Transposase, Tc1-like protein [Ipomoea batatas]